MLKWLSNLFSSKEVVEDVSEQKEEYDTRMICEPVFTFVEYVKKYPKNFKISRHARSLDFHPWQNPEKFYELTDKVLGDSWIIYIGQKEYVRGRCRGQEEYLFQVDNLPFDLNHWEKDYLYKELRPVLAREKARERKQRILWAAQERARLERKRVEQIARDEYLNKYKEAL